MFVRDLADVRDLFDSVSGTITGVGITAYSRIMPAYFHQPYYIIALRKTLDLPLLRKRAEIFCLEEELGHFVEAKGFNSESLLSHPSVRAFLKKMTGPRYLLLYQSYPDLEELAERQGWVLLANPSSLRMRVADRAFFRKMANKLELNRVPGAIYPLDDFLVFDYAYWAQKIGPELVVQFPEIRQGGGRGTFFVKSDLDYQRVRKILKVGTWRGIKIETVAIYKFLDGTPASVALCLTRHGILFSGLQRQLIDLPYCEDISESGIFCGHSWGETAWSSHVQAEAVRQASLIGEYLAGIGYKGILGIDFLISRDKKQVYPLECNPRFTGAFPMLSQLQLWHNIIPMDVFHMLELLDLPYEMDPASLNERYGEAIRGSHIILFSGSNALLTGDGLREAGLYECDPESGRIYFVAGASDYREMRNERQFIIIDGPPDMGENGLALRDPIQRLCRILFPNPILTEGETLSPGVLSAVDWVYDQMFGESRR
ncbi:MAG: ATP-grasp domain-containing protein [Desulfobacteraceae bacterium]|jgi:hypothetical protein